MRTDREPKYRFRCEGPDPNRGRATMAWRGQTGSGRHGPALAGLLFAVVRREHESGRQGETVEHSFAASKEPSRGECEVVTRKSPSMTSPWSRAVVGRPVDSVRVGTGTVEGGLALAVTETRIGGAGTPVTLRTREPFGGECSILVANGQRERRLHGGSDSVKGANGRSPSMSGLRRHTRLAEERWVQAAVGAERR